MNQVRKYSDWEITALLREIIDIHTEIHARVNVVVKTEERFYENFPQATADHYESMMSPTLDVFRKGVGSFTTKG